MFRFSLFSLWDNVYIQKITLQNRLHWKIRKFGPMATVTRQPRVHETFDHCKILPQFLVVLLKVEV